MPTWLHFLKKSLMENFIFCAVILILRISKHFQTTSKSLRLHFQTLSLTANPNLQNLFVNQCRFFSQIHHPPTLVIDPLFAIYRNLNNEVLP